MGTRRLRDGHRERVVCAVGEVHVIIVIPMNLPMTDEAVSNVLQEEDVVKIGILE